MMVDHGYTDILVVLEWLDTLHAFLNVYRLYYFIVMWGWVVLLFLSSTVSTLFIVGTVTYYVVCNWHENAVQ
jgi:hypothetical protein